MIEGLSIEDPILALDLSTSCVGYCILREKDHYTNHLLYPDKLPGTLWNFRKNIINMTSSLRPAVICIEAPIVGKGADTLPLAMMHGVAQEALSTYTGLGPIDIHGSTWKSQVLGTNRITTKQKKDGLIARTLTRMGFPVDHIDEADALAIALCFRKQHFGKLTVD